MGLWLLQTRLNPPPQKKGRWVASVLTGKERKVLFFVSVGCKNTLSYLSIVVMNEAYEWSVECVMDKKEKCNDSILNES
jgi:hypothetical protein